MSRMQSNEMNYYGGIPHYKCVRHGESTCSNDLLGKEKYTMQRYIFLRLGTSVPIWRRLRDETFSVEIPNVSEPQVPMFISFTGFLI